MQYQIAHGAHVFFVTVSVILFIYRGTLMLDGSDRLRTPLLKVLPHVVDTLLLASALWTVWTLHLSLLHTAWLHSKILGLLIYIALGVVALRPGPRGLAVRGTAFVAALVTVGWIVSVAVSHDPLGFLRPLVA